MRPSFKFCWLLIFPWVKLSWHSYSMWDKLGWLSWFWRFLCEGLSSFYQKGFYYLYAWSCSLCDGRTPFCLGLISRKLWGFLLMLWLALLHLLSYFFFLCQSPPLSLCMVFDSISSNIEEVLLINPSPSVFVDFNIYHKDCLTYSDGTDRPGELCYNLKSPHSAGFYPSPFAYSCFFPKIQL